MSASASLATTPLADAERVDVRRFCGYPAYGPGASGFQSWRFFQAYGMLEFRLTNMAPSELQVVRQYLANLYMLEAAVPAAGANLDTDQAAVWRHNKNEVADRAALFDQWGRRLCGFLGIPPGQSLGAPGAIII
ncbi:hypothetical protein NFI95_15610 [Acetobacteraceae bacterium KSS8]|uniref:Uncharacterized protein n=1 Tax=Endosaccharibacter trunci TaxID=2812733 RepID=A0ABT1WCM8_9PROT|nr:hypothetical protein [Acetobacteraceae bacterium KSS8]